MADENKAITLKEYLELDKFKNINVFTLEGEISDSAIEYGAIIYVIQFAIGTYGKFTMFQFRLNSCFNNNISRTCTFTLSETFLNEDINFTNIVGQTFQQKGDKESSSATLAITNYNTCTLTLNTVKGDSICPAFTFFI